MKTKNKKTVLHPIAKNNRGPGSVSRTRPTRRVARKIPPISASGEKITENDEWVFFWDL